MAKEFSKAFYSSAKWKACRENYIANRVAIDGGMCECCHEQLGYIVHHKTKLTRQNINNPDITLSLSNLEYVCKDCHDIIHHTDIHGNEIKKPRCGFDEHGNMIVFR